MIAAASDTALRESSGTVPAPATDLSGPQATLGPLRLDSPAVLAPLAGYTESAMRRISRHYGAGLVFSEMLSGEGVRRKNAKSLKMAQFHAEERPYVIQFFATNPEQAADATRVLTELEPDGLDLNFGCPVKRIILNQGGAALLKDVALLARIVEAAVKATHVPVSVKIRSGWDHRSLNAVEVARAVADSGASWITVHARTRSEFFEGKAHWAWIGEVKANVNIPVVGNGDVRTAQDAARLQEMTGCDAVMIGRAAIGYPFVFREIRSQFLSGDPGPPPTPGERWKAARQHLMWMTELWGERRTALEFRKHLIAYVKGLPNAARFKTVAMRTDRVALVLSLLEEYLLALPDCPMARPVSMLDDGPEWK